MIYRFGVCSLDTQTHELYRNGQLVPLQPKVFQVLTYLIGHRHRLVTKQELLDQLWAKQFVHDSVVPRCIMAARKATGDTQEGVPSITTLRGQGYRFICDVTERIDHPLRGTKPDTSSTVSFVPSRYFEAVEALPEQAFPAPALPVPEAEPLVSGTHMVEQKWVTALCCTLTGIYGNVNGHAPETQHHLLHTFLDLAVPEVRRYGGILQSVNQESLLALFGAPVAYEDHAKRAVLTAVGLRGCLHALYVEAGLAVDGHLGIRLGLHTGLMMVGQIGGDVPMSYAAGDVTDTATRLATSVPLGTIAVSEATARLVRHSVHMAALACPEEVQHATPQPGGYHILTVAARRGLDMPMDKRASTRFVGRQRELATLHALCDLVQQGHGQVVSIIGEPGLGKSRLLYEFRRGISPQVVTYLMGACVSYGRMTPYLPIREVLRQHCGVTDDDRPETTEAKVIRRLQGVGMAPEASALPLLQLLGIPDTAGQAKAFHAPIAKLRLFEALQQLTLNESRRRPLVVELEDVHWIDTASEEYVTTLIDRLSGAAILLLMTFRPGYRPAWMGKSYATQIALSPLSLQESHQVLCSVLPAAPTMLSLRAGLAAKAAGNPFFLEELACDASTHCPAQQPLRVPETIQSVLAAYVDRLPLAEKHMLQIAAVIGVDVPFSFFQAVTGLSEEPFCHSLTHLQNAEFLHATQLLPEPIYTFKQRLLQEVVYTSLPQRTRQQLHAQIVHVCRERFPDMLQTQPEWFAQHSRAAGHSAEATGSW